MIEQNRSLNTVAEDIRQSWKNISFNAAPYVDALESMNRIEDIYLVGNGVSVVEGFLANASSFRGADAKRIKAELEAMIIHCK
tara:strand:+ start:486 stop:734 length:249 start_codon:yes stop_codon:yes gene_type:complete